MSSALSFVLARLDAFEAPLLLQQELDAFPAREVARLRGCGILRESLRADEIERPTRYPGGGRVAVRDTAHGMFGVAPEGEAFFDPIPLTNDDVRQFEVSIAVLVERLRQENSIAGSGFVNHAGLIPLGQRAVAGAGTVDVYLSLANGDERDVLTRCQRLARRDGAQRVVLVTPRGVALSPEGRTVLDASGVVLASIAASASDGTLGLHWSGVLPTSARDTLQPSAGGGAKTAGLAGAVGPALLGLDPSCVRVIRAYQEHEARRGARRGLPAVPTLGDLTSDTGLARATVVDARERLVLEALLEQIPGALKGKLRLTQQGLDLRLPAEAATVQRPVQ